MLQSNLCHNLIYASWKLGKLLDILLTLLHCGVSGGWGAVALLVPLSLVPSPHKVGLAHLLDIREV